MARYPHDTSPIVYYDDDVRVIYQEQSCPCCGDHDLSKECTQVHDESGNLQCFTLFHICNVCGCRWRNGQELPKESPC